MISTEAWVIRKGAAPGRSALDTGDFRRETFSFPEPEEDELLIEPLHGCWEGNMSHAIQRRPIDVCHQRGEDAIVVGNAGVARILKAGRGAAHLREGEVGAVFGTGAYDRFGYMVQAYAYDAPNTVGLLAKRTKIKASNFLPIPPDSPYTTRQWAAYMVRYLTAWSNWKVALGAYRLQVSEAEHPSPHVWAWGGGTSFAELDLARRQGCQVAMLSGSDEHLEMMGTAGLPAIDRRAFGDLRLDEKKYAADPAYKAAYQEAEGRFLRCVKERTGGMGVSIFVDHIGGPLIRATLKALGREGVISTAGWMLGMNLPTNRAIECIGRHVHVHTHYARLSDWPEATEFSLKTGWMPEVTEVYPWDDIEALARNAVAGKVTYFPVFEVNSP